MHNPKHPAKILDRMLIDCNQLNGIYRFMTFLVVPSEYLTM